MQKQTKQGAVKNVLFGNTVFISAQRYFNLPLDSDRSLDTQNQYKLKSYLNSKSVKQFIDKNKQIKIARVVKKKIKTY
jgi:hypothetical protein